MCIRDSLVDGTLISCANYPGCQHRSEFAEYASFGYCPSKSQYIWGMRLVMICDIDGGHPGSLLFADKGLWGKELDASMELINVQLITPERHQLGKRPPAEIT